jgi:hypothetical protein
MEIPNPFSRGATAGAVQGAAQVATVLAEKLVHFRKGIQQS